MKIWQYRASVAKARGYTVIEVMLVLVITGVIFASAVAMFNGVGGNTQFQQAINDLNSKLTTSIKAVTSELFPQTEQFSCQNSSGKPTLTRLSGSSTQAQGTNEDCVYLGKAFEVVPNKNQLYIYTVIGNRTYTINSAPDPQIVTDFLQANPTAAIDSNPDPTKSTDLTETYTLASSSAKLKKAYINGDSTTDADIAGFYNGLGATSAVTAQSGSFSLLAKGYKIKTQGSNVRNNLQNCIGESGGCGAGIDNLTDWELCFQDKSANQTALITITVSSNAAQSVVKFKGC